MKDDGVLSISELTSGSMAIASFTIDNGTFKGSTLVKRNVTFKMANVAEQGFYWCRIQDSFGRVVDSKKASIILIGKNPI